MAAAAGGRELDQTPTWAVLVVCFAIIAISIALEKVFHWIEHVFTEKRKMSMVEALEKIKAELMILGFISLLLTFTQNYLIKICIPEKVADTMLPCKSAPNEGYSEGDAGHHRRLLWENMLMDMDPKRRFLAAPAGDSCSYGKVPLISIHGLHQLHIFIFFLAVFHVVSSAMIMSLGRLKIRAWKHWENDALSSDYKISNDPSRIHYAEDNTFVRQHIRWWNKNVILLFITSFFRQFYRSVRRDDYLTLRHGFISAHIAPGSKFDFQKYIKRSLEDDFKVVVGISPILWASAGIILLLNLEGWHTMFWISFLPLVILLAVGTKLQAIITKIAIEISNKHVMIQGVPLVILGDHHFWFHRPNFILFLIHFTLFENAFQLVYFLWIWYSFGLNSCFHQKVVHLIARVCIGTFVQFLCSYVTLPLYALMSQLGSSMKASIFDEHTSKALKKWHKNAKKPRHDRLGAQTQSRTLVSSSTTSLHVSPKMQDNDHAQHGNLEMGSLSQKQPTTQIHSEECGDDLSYIKATKA